MKFEIDVNGRPHAVKIERTGSRYRIEADGRVDVVDVARVDATTMSMILVGDREASHEAALLEGRERGEVEVYLRAGVVQTRVSGAPGQRRWGATGGVGAGVGGGPQPVTAPMPGKIVRVLVKPGDAVTARQGLVVIEAMKMENELKAARDGRVKEVHATEGALVEAGRLLLVIE
ncbi:MAG TPA: acetyl-CoA carboxylase biotin carboxyl carrier protein subunit [Vicinamibacterales bacterium]|jgi:biotin carboxyl carrier protein